MKYTASNLKNKYLNDQSIDQEKAVRKFKDIEAKYKKTNKKRLLMDMAELCIKAGQMDDARTLLEKSIKADPENPKNYRLMGEIYLFFHFYREAALYFEKALKLFPDYEEALRGAANSYSKLEHYETAAKYLQQALKLNESAENYNDIGVLLFHAGYYDQSLSYLLRSHSLEPDNIQYLISYTKVLIKLGRFKEASNALYETIKMDEEDGYLMEMMTLVFKEFKVQSFDPKTKEIISYLLGKPDIQHMNLCNAWSATFLLDSDYQEIKKSFEFNEYEAFAKNCDLVDFEEEIQDEFLTNGLRLLLNLSTGFELTLTHIRRMLLNEVLDGRADGLVERWPVFLCALAENCFLNEYIFLLSEQEQEQIEVLKQRIESQEENDDNMRLMLALLGCYEPMYRQSSEIRNCVKSLKEGAQEFFKTFVVLQLDEPLEEERLKEEIPILGNITDIVSQKVREQYEENPYPRWRNINLERDKKQGSVLFNQSYEILIAGCGTGKQIMHDRQKYPYANITAVDLSRSSIAYAQRKMNEMGVENIQISQADILELGNAFGDKKFDFVMCSGVLHHMHDPEAGLKVLKSLLKPEGQMNIGLYSEYAREKVVEYRNMVEENEWPSTPEGIRALREYVMGLDNADPMKAVASWRDFYTTSMCRDLLFHVQEHRYTFPKLKDMFERFDLDFLAFSYLPVSVMQGFLKKFPDKQDYYDFDKWEEFEKENKTAFAGMYQMWICNKEAKETIQSRPPITAQILP